MLRYLTRYRARPNAAFVVDAVDVGDGTPVPPPLPPPPPPSVPPPPLSTAADLTINLPTVLPAIVLAPGLLGVGTVLTGWYPQVVAQPASKAVVTALATGALYVAKNGSQGVGAYTVTFTYKLVDGLGDQSNTATVTLNVPGL